MHYFFPPNWTIEGVHLYRNQDLSKQDIYFLRLWYPARIDLPMELVDTTTPPEVLYTRAEQTVSPTVVKECNQETMYVVLVMSVLVAGMIGFLLWRTQYPKD
jgi:hypothetical protein